MAKFDIDPELVRKLSDLLNETGLSEIEYAAGEQRIRVTRAMAAAETRFVAAPPAAATAQQAPAPETNDAAHPGAITAPMVGTAYLTPDPDSEPFVRVGDTVREGQTLLIIEAMKVMNPIRAPRGGTVAKILIETATPVEFGEPLMILE